MRSAQGFGQLLDVSARRFVEFLRGFLRERISFSVILISSQAHGTRAACAHPVPRWCLVPVGHHPNTTSMIVISLQLTLPKRADYHSTVPASLVRAKWTNFTLFTQRASTGTQVVVRLSSTGCCETVEHYAYSTSPGP